MSGIASGSRCLLSERDSDPDNPDPPPPTRRRTRDTTDISGDIEAIHNILYCDHETNVRDIGEVIADEDSDGIMEDSESEDELDIMPEVWGEEEEEEEQGAVVVRRPPHHSFAWTDGNDFSVNTYRFDERNCGVMNVDNILDDESKPFDYFCLLFDEEILQHIVNETNKYYALMLPLLRDRIGKMRKWHNVDVGEMYSFFALLMLMPHIKKHAVRDYWMKHSLIGTPVFGKYMPRDRFFEILRFIHFVDNNEPVENDRCWKVRFIMSRLISKYKEFFSPYQKLNIDESLVLFRGRIIFRQYIPSKRHRFGIKLFILCDCKTGIILDAIVYSGSNVDIPANDPLGMSGAVVKRLMEGYFDKGHILYTDNFYTSPSLSYFLHERNTGTIGTVRKNRKHMPKFPGRPPRGTVDKLKSDPMLAVRWTDKREVTMLTTIHKGTMVPSGKSDRRTQVDILKPDVVMDYTKNMRLIDKSDAQIGTIECVRRSVKCYKKLFFHMVDVTMLNSYNMYKNKTGKKITLRHFSLEVISKLLEKYGRLTSSAPGRHYDVAPDRLMAKNYISRHYLQDTPIPAGANRKAQRLCHVCYNTERRQQTRKKVTTQCAECEVPLCLPCFKDYHTLTKF